MTLRKWQREYRDHIATLSAEDLFDEMIDAQVADGWDGCFTDRALWRANESTRQVHDKCIHDAKLAALVTEETAELLERLAGGACVLASKYTFAERGLSALQREDEKAARKLAAQIRETLDEH